MVDFHYLYDEYLIKDKYNILKHDVPSASGEPSALTQLQSEFTDWLYGEYDERKLKQFSLLYSLPVVRNYMDYLLDYRAGQEYLNRYGLDYSNIHDPRKFFGVRTLSTFVSGGLNFVSHNVGKLYR